MKLPKRFHLRISVIFWLLIAVFAGLQAVLSFYMFWSSYYEWEQRLNWSLAEDLAHELRPLLDEDVDSDLLRKELHRISIANPKISVYVLDLDGVVKVSTEARNFDHDYEDFVDTEPIEEFLAVKKNRSLPLWGVRPTSPFDTGTRKRLFSAAKIKFESEPGYLYVILHNKKANSSLVGVQDAFLYVGIVISSLILTIIIGAIGTTLFFMATGRFRKIATLVHKITEGDFGERIPEKGEDEIAQLSCEINQMADAIEESIEKLNEKDTLRRELVANVSHDLRSPLSSMLAYLETMAEKEKTLSEGERRQYLHVAIGNVRSTLR